MTFQDTGKPIGTLKLVKSEAKETRIKKKNLQILVSEHNGDFMRYTKDFDFTDEVEPRPEGNVRVLSLKGLEIGPEYKYLVIAANISGGQRNISNLNSRLLELYDTERNRLPAMADEGVIPREKVVTMIERIAVFKSGDSRIHEDKLPSKDYGTEIGLCSFVFDGGGGSVVRVLDIKPDPERSFKNGYVAVARGWNKYVTGAMHPAYPEVRGNWVDMIRSCVAVGIDGVDIQVANHSCWNAGGPEDFGFNEPVVAEYTRRHGDINTNFDVECWKALHGEYFTQFLREAKKELEIKGLPLQMHINYLMAVRPKWWSRNNVPSYFRWEYEKWIVEDIVDAISLKYLPWPWGAERGVGSKKGLGSDYAVKIANLAKEHGKKVYYSARMEHLTSLDTRVSRQVPRPNQKELTEIKERLDWGYRTEMVDGVILHEVDNFTVWNAEKRMFIGVPEIEKMISSYTWTKRWEDWC